jgi:hypothetical protein
VYTALPGMVLNEGPNSAGKRAAFSGRENAGKPAWLVSNRLVKPY